MSARPRVLLIAEAANPEFISVPLVGWSLAQALRKVVDVHIVTQVRNRDAFLRAGLTEGVDFTAIDSELIARPLWKLAKLLRMGDGRGWTTVAAISTVSYAYFEYLVWKKFKKDIRQRSFDIVHRVTPLSPAKASPIAKHCRRAGVPFVLGPLNGGVPWPRGFDIERRREGEWLSYLRGAYQLLPGRLKTLHAASAILVGSRTALREVPKRLQKRCIYLPENGIDPERFFRIAQPGKDNLLKACFIGRMVPLKGTDMLIEAAAPLLRARRMTLNMIGDGPLLPELQATVAREGLSDSVRFHGWLDHWAIQEILVKCDVLTFPSIREFGGGAVLEAMALGVPPIVVDYGGPGELVTEGRGLKIPIRQRAELVSEMAAILERLVADPSVLSEMGANARSWVHEKLTWQRKAEQILDVYAWVLRPSTARPTFFGTAAAIEAGD